MNRKKTKLDVVLQLLSALVLAIIVWFTVNERSSNIVTRNILNVPVTVTNEDVLAEKNLSIDDNLNYFVNLEVRGTEDNLNAINLNDLSAEIDVGEIEDSGTHNMDIIVKGLNNTVILDNTVPGTLSVKVDEKDTQIQTPTIVTQGKPKDGYSVISATTDEMVEVDGPEADVNSVDHISGVVDVEGLDSNTTKLVSLNAYNKDGSIISTVTCIPDVVEANIKIGATKEVSVKAPKVNGTPLDDYKITSITVSPQKVTIAGSPEVLQEINDISTAPVDIPVGSNDKSFTVESSLVLPDGVSLLSKANPINVTVNIEQIIEKEYTVTDLEAVGIAENLKIERINPGSILITVRGTTSELKKVDSSNLKGTVDVSGLKEGTHELKVNVTVNGVNVIEINPEKVEVQIETK